jgi:hypothetical protein
VKIKEKNDSLVHIFTEEMLCPVIGVEKINKLTQLQKYVLAAGEKVVDCLACMRPSV